MNEDNTWQGGEGRRHVLCFGLGSAEVRMGKLRSFQFPSHTASTSHHTALWEQSRSPQFPRFLLFCTPPILRAPAWCLLGWLLGVRVPATSSELPHPRCKARGTLTHTWSVSDAACPWLGHSSPLQLGQGEMATSGHQYTS